MRYNFCSSPPNDAVGKCVYYFFAGAIAVGCVLAFWPVILAAVCFTGIYKMFK